jgi:hypothetical protein
MTLCAGSSALSARQTLPALPNYPILVLPTILHKDPSHSRTLFPRHDPQALRSELRYFRLPLGPKLITTHDIRASETLVPMVLVYLFRIYVCESIAFCLPNLDLAIYVLHPHGCSIRHCFLRLLWRGHPASHSGALQYEHGSENARNWHMLSVLFQCTSRDWPGPNFERLTVCVLRTFTVSPCPPLTQVFGTGTVTQGEPK